MNASAIKPKLAYINGVRVERRSVGIRSGRQVVTFTLADGTTVSAVADGFVEGASTRVEIPAGPTGEGWYVAAAPKHRANHGKWRGERDMRRREWIMATHAVFGER